MKTALSSTAALIGLWVLPLFSPSPVGAATYTVINTLDIGVGSLRWAVTQANANPGWDLIDFNIPGPGPQTISLLSALPQLIDPNGVMIDGLTQPGSNAGPNPPSTANLQIMIDGTMAGPSHGFWIVSCHNTVQGLVIGSFEQDGVRIQGMPSGTFDNHVITCFVGTDQGTVANRGNGWNQMQYWAGVSVIVTPGAVGFAYDNTVEFSQVVCNYSEGVQFSNCPPGDVHHNLAFGNYIGTDLGGGAPLPNAHYGVYIGEGARQNDVVNNLISANLWGGVSICGYAQIQIRTWGNNVTDNVIGLAIDRVTPLPNAGNGIDIGQYGATREGFAPDNYLCRNFVAENQGTGIAVWEHPSTNNNADGNCITENSMWDNWKLGIDLGDDGVTPVDVADPDAGPNQDLNHPVILSADYVVTTTLTTVVGWLDIDTPLTSARVEVFKARLDPSGCGEGETFLGSTVPDAAGNWTFTAGGLAPGDTVTATSIDMNNNASEFSPSVPVMLSPVAVGESLLALDREVRLEPARPNPFAGSTDIQWVLPEPMQARLCVLDVAGRLVRTLADGVFEEGTTRTRWDGRDAGGSRVAAGMYLLRLEVGSRSVARKVLVVN